jgi:hypothetical protein
VLGRRDGARTWLERIWVDVLTLLPRSAFAHFAGREVDSQCAWSWQNAPTPWVARPPWRRSFTACPRWRRRFAKGLRESTKGTGITADAVPTPSGVPRNRATLALREVKRPAARRERRRRRSLVQERRATAVPRRRTLAGGTWCAESATDTACVGDLASKDDQTRQATLRRVARSDGRSDRSDTGERRRARSGNDLPLHRSRDDRSA